MEEFRRGDVVRKDSGDYVFIGTVVAVFNKLAKQNGEAAVRVVVEDERGLLLIMNPSQLKLVSGTR